MKPLDFRIQYISLHTFRHLLSDISAVTNL